MVGSSSKKLVGSAFAKEFFMGKSGAELKYDNGAGSMNLKDQGGASMNFDGAGNAAVNANADHTSTAGQNHTTNAGNTKVIQVGKGSESLLKMDKDGNISLNGTSSLK